METVNMRLKRISSLSIAERLSAGGNLTIGEFADWAGIGRVKAYSEISAGRLALTKIGKCSRIAAADALRWRDLMREASRSPHAA